MSNNPKRRRRFALPLNLEQRILLSNSWNGAPMGLPPSIETEMAGATPASRVETSGNPSAGPRAVPVAEQFVVSARQGNVLDLISPSGPLAGLQFERRLNPTTAVFRLPVHESSTVGPLAAGSQRNVWQTSETARQFAATLPQVAWTSPLLQSEGTEQWTVPTNEVIVALKPGQLAADFFRNDSRFSGYRPLAGTPDQFIATIANGGGDQALRLAEALQSDPRLAWAQANAFRDIQRFSSPNDPLFNLQWHLENNGIAGGVVDADVDVTGAWELTTGSAQTIIAVVDDGMELTHPDLAPNLFVNPGEIPENGVDDDANGYIDDIHGWDFTTNGTLGDNNPGADSVYDRHATSVAGLAAGVGNNGIGVTGVAQTARILPVRIFGSDGWATTDANIASAVYYAAGRTRDGLGQWANVQVMNNSWGGGWYSDAITAAFTWAAGSARGGLGTAVLISSGNGYSPWVSFPASLAATIPGVMAVGATTNFDTRSDYSNYGSALSFVAPSNGRFYGGTADMVTVDRVGTNGYNWSNSWAGPGSDDYTDRFGGTSSAAPVSAGIAALALSRAADLGISLSAEQVKGLLRNTTDLVGPATVSYDNVTGVNAEYGTGRVNAAAAVRGVGIAELGVFEGRAAVTNGTTFDLGSLRVGRTQSRTFRVRNEGTSPLSLAGLSITGAAAFTISSGLGSKTLAVGESTSFTVQFAPTARGVQAAQITLLSNDADEGTFTLNLNATGATLSIQGSLFEDWDGNQIREAYDPAVVGRTVYIDENSNGVLDRAADPRTIATGQINLPIIGFTYSSLAVAGLSGPIVDMDLTVNISHSWVGDLRMWLRGPNGLWASLTEPLGDLGNGFQGTIFDDQASTPITEGQAPFTGRFRPKVPLSTFNGTDPNGVWYLVVDDVSNLEFTGTVNDWSLTFSVFEEPVAYSDVDGLFEFENLPAGTQSVRVAPLSEWITPPPQVVNRPTDDTTIQNVNLPLSHSDAVYSWVYDDPNGNGVADSDESGLLNQAVFLDINSNGLFDPVTQLSQVASEPLNQPFFGGDAGGVSSSLLVTNQVGMIRDVNVTVNILHPQVFHLQISLQGPSGKSVPLKLSRYGNGANLSETIFDDEANIIIGSGTSPFSGRFVPASPLRVFDGDSPNGTWTLTISDRTGTYAGMLSNWSLTFTTGELYCYSDFEGRVRFDHVEPGTQIVRQTIPEGVALTSPPGGFSTHSLSPGGVVHAAAFGNRNLPGSFLEGSLYEDWDGNLTRESYDPLIWGEYHEVFVYADTNTNGVFDGPIVSTIASGAVNAMIPDNDSAGITDGQTVSGLDGVISNIDVTLNVTHSRVGDLRVQLQGPNQFTINLVERRGGTGASFTETVLDDGAMNRLGDGTAPFTGRFQPEVPLSNFHGIDPNGTWTLIVSDLSDGTQGVLNDWSLRIETSSVATEKSFTTYGYGPYWFPWLPTGPLVLGVAPTAAWTALSNVSVDMPSSPTTTMVADLPLARRNSVYTRVFQDLDGDGLAAPSEPGLPGQTVLLDVDKQPGDDQLSFSSGIVNLPIPANDYHGIASTIEVSGFVGTITDLDVTINVNHSAVGDLMVYLTSPSGTTVEVAAFDGGRGDNFTNTVFDDEAPTEIDFSSAPFTGRFRPHWPLSLVDGEFANGAWTLRVGDHRYGSDTGTLLDWKLEFRGETSDRLAVSDADGLVRFDHVPPGTTGIQQFQSRGWILTTPPGGVGSQTLIADGVSFAPLFGNFPDTTSPNVLSIVRASANPTKAASVSWTVTFSEAVTGLSLANFSLTAIGPMGATLTGLSGSGSSYTVTASTGIGDGSLGLDLTSTANVLDIAFNPLRITMVRTISSGPLDLSIPEDGSQSVEATLKLAGVLGSVTDVDVTLNMTHTWLGSLGIALRDPNATSAFMVYFNAYGEEFINTTFDDDADSELWQGESPYTGHYLPYEPLSIFNTIDPNGTWTLETTNFWYYGEGVLHDWSLRIESERPTFTGEVYAIDKKGAPNVLEYRVVYGNGRTFNVLGSTRNILPWQITGIQVLFDEPIAFANLGSLGGLTATGLTGLGTALVTWTIDPVAQGRLNTVLRATGPNFIGDTAGNRLSGGTDYLRSLRILWGDFTGDGVVNSADLSGVNNQTIRPYNLFADLNGDGLVNTSDVAIVRRRLGTRL